ncbi:hypothetical protein [Williamsia maris]|uniref:Restriction endonuclease n=1 Tax=Williamsia maris TaxID=72806 RepID=A0ABT1HE99_9NOCA|nr:hypothetical protein [Williamsia maris]MCP2176573.1 hypothetical protein [Williamsia maris]
MSLDTWEHPARWRIHEWAEYGLDQGLDATLAEIDAQSWSDGRTGCIDESMASFNSDEAWIARVLAAEGHTVIALPRSLREGVKSADASVSGLLTEFKTYSGISSKCLSNKVVCGLRQADRVVVRVTAGLGDPTEVRQVFDSRVRASGRGRMRGLKFIGDDFHFEWGSWNRHVCDPSSDTVAREPGAQSICCVGRNDSAAAVKSFSPAST